MPRDLFAEQQEPKDLFAGLDLESEKGFFEKAGDIGRAIFTPSTAPEQAKKDVAGVGEAALTVGSSILAEPVSGVAGIVQAANPLADEGAGGEAVGVVRNALTYEPRTPEGRENLKALGNTLKPITELLEKAEQASGDVGYDLAGAVGGAIGETIPTAIAEVLGLGAGKKSAQIGNRLEAIAEAKPDEKTKSILDAGKEFDVPVMNTDVNPPETFAGRFAQSVSEKLGVLGTGKARASQQAAREQAIVGFAEALDVDMDSPFAQGVVNSLNSQTAQTLQRAGNIRRGAIDSLDKFGEVDLSKTFKAIDQQIAKQARLGEKGDAALVDNLNKTKSSLEKGDFSLVADIRTELIDDIKAVRRSEDVRSAASLQKVKSAMDGDMLDFAKKNDRDAAADWVRSNRAFADAYTRTKDTELKRILKSGDATPEKIMPLLRGGKLSELKRLKKSIGDDGVIQAQKAIIQDALKDSRFFEVDSNPNPDAFATALNKANRQQAINVFFSGRDKAQIDGLTRLLNATRKAQSGQAVIKTGEQVIPATIGGGLGAAAYADPFFGFTTAAVTSGIAKAYESKAFRDLLVRLKNSQPKSKVESRILDAAVTSVVSELQAAKTRQEETQ